MEPEHEASKIRCWNMHFPAKIVLKQAFGGWNMYSPEDMVLVLSIYTYPKQGSTQILDLVHVNPQSQQYIQQQC